LSCKVAKGTQAPTKVSKAGANPPPSSSVKPKILVLFYSTYGHVYTLAKEIVEGAKSAGADVDLKRVQETLPKEVLEKLVGVEPAKQWEQIPIAVATDLAAYDAIIIGCPNRFGGMAAQMKTFVDSLGQLWFKDELVGKFVSFFTSSGSQHGGIETTIFSSMIPFLHLGCVIVGLPYSFTGQKNMDEIIGPSPYGSATVAGKGDRQPVKTDLEGARFQGKHVAEMATRITRNK